MVFLQELLLSLSSDNVHCDTGTRDHSSIQHQQRYGYWCLLLCMWNLSDLCFCVFDRYNHDHYHRTDRTWYHSNESFGNRRSDRLWLWRKKGIESTNNNNYRHSPNVDKVFCWKQSKIKYMVFLQQTNVRTFEHSMNTNFEVILETRHFSKMLLWNWNWNWNWNAWCFCNSSDVFVFATNECSNARTLWTVNCCCCFCTSLLLSIVNFSPTMVNCCVTFLLCISGRSVPMSVPKRIVSFAFFTTMVNCCVLFCFCCLFVSRFSIGIVIGHDVSHDFYSWLICWLKQWGDLFLSRMLVNCCVCCLNLMVEHVVVLCRLISFQECRLKMIPISGWESGKVVVVVVVIIWVEAGSDLSIVVAVVDLLVVVRTRIVLFCDCCHDGELLCFVFCPKVLLCRHDVTILYQILYLVQYMYTDWPRWVVTRWNLFTIWKN